MKNIKIWFYFLGALNYLGAILYFVKLIENHQDGTQAMAIIHFILAILLFLI